MKYHRIANVFESLAAFFVLEKKPLRFKRQGNKHRAEQKRFHTITRKNILQSTRALQHLCEEERLREPWGWRRAPPEGI